MATVTEPIPAIESDGIEPTRIMLRPLLALDHEQFLLLAQQNSLLRMELSAQGEVLIMAPTGSITGWHNGEISCQLANWNKQHQRGLVFDSSTLFGLPRGSIRSPDASWVEKTRWQALSKKEKEAIAPLCPDFVIELRSKTDRLVVLKKKMDEYLANGAQLGWLVDPLLRQVHLYEQGQSARLLDQPASVLGTGCVAGFELDLKEIFAEIE